MVSVQDPMHPEYAHLSYTNKHRQLLQTAMDGGRLQDGRKSPWDTRKQQVFGTNGNPYGQCRILPRARRLTSKQLGVCVGKKKEWSLHQAMFVCAFGNLPLNECEDYNSSWSDSALVIAHSCGRNTCFVTDHMDVVLHKNNLMHCRCHDDIFVRNQMDCFEGDNKGYGLGRRCWWRHDGLRCHYNFKKCRRQ